jgi:polysaccharide deacetylase family protein (PEP-CTERM system associated)
MPAPPPRLIFSVDVEDWPQSSWNRSLPISDYCADNARRLLDLLGGFPHSRGTFFVLGKFAERHPDVVRRIQADGHEVACHSYGHEEIFHLTREAFAADIARATGLLSDLVGQSPRGYRAPDFSVVAETLWALDVLAEQGYAYDSSIFPLDKARYGIGTWPTDAVRVALDNGRTIAEFPLTVMLWRGRRVPISGGGYARLLPRPLLRRWLRAEAGRRRIPPVFYCHPYELDPGEFRRLKVPVPLKVRLHQGLGRRGLARKLRMLLERFTCCSFSQVLADAGNVATIAYGPYKLAPGAVTRPGISWQACGLPAARRGQTGMTQQPPMDELERVTDSIRAEYARRREHPKSSPGHAMFDARLRHYTAMFDALGLRPLGDRRILDVGCANGKWLALCCARWGAQPERCVGVDLQSDFFEPWRRENPDSPIQLRCMPAHTLDFPDAAFDVVHHSMMFSSVTGAPLRDCIAAAMWRVLRPGGTLLSYDFWINPLNAKVVGITRRELRRLFPEARWAWARTITVAPPFCRLLNKIDERLAVRLEPLRILNTHYLVALTRRS